MYLRKMGSVSLLTREGEVEIAKRIEQGEHRHPRFAILNSPVAVREIIDLGDKLRKHKIRVKDIIRDADDEDREFDEEEAPTAASFKPDRQGQARSTRSAQDLGVSARELRRSRASKGIEGRDRSRTS